MVFSSHLFLFYFLPLALLVYYALPRWGKHLGLTVLSYAFYGWANPLFVVLMLFSTVIDFACGLAMTGQLRPGAWGRPVPLLTKDAPRSRCRKLALLISICTNLSLLGFFKYFNLAAESYDGIINAVGLPGLSLDLAFKITLPLGISFYTFQSMSYSIDVYRGDARAIRNPVTFACYVSMFPQLVAGPIIRFQEVAEQLEHRTHTTEKFARGVSFFCMGMAKKVLLANACGKIADMVFDADSAGLLDAWYGAAAYAFQIYFDFSAYSDMAIGLGLMLGFVFPKNFDSPYRAESITEFWRRWHISLSYWLRLYLYYPLGGSLKGSRRTVVNLAVVMLLGGLWHGASWNFVIWGAIHGAVLIFERVQGKRSLYRALPRPLKIAITFAIVCFAWVFFRAPDLPSALHYCGSMLGLREAWGGAALIGGLTWRPYYLLFFAIAAAVTWACPQTWDWTRKISPLKAVVMFVLFWYSLIVLATQSYNPFIYFIF